MTPDIRIVTGRPEHVRELALTMRAADQREIACLDIAPHRALWRSYRQSLSCRSGLVDGKVAAMWGVGGELLGSTGRPWLLTSELVESVPVTFAKVYRREVAAMLEMFPRLESWVHADYHVSIRMLRLAGFTVAAPVAMHPNGALFRRFEKVRA